MIDPMYLISLLIGGGATAAIIKAWSQLKSKRMDIAIQERKQFVKELNDMRNEVNKLYANQNQLMRENGELRIRIKELEGHITHKSGKLNELKVLVKEYNESIENDAQEVFIRKVTELVE
jgi:peptidoglycan hydrolase CwlO-like protein